MHRTYDHPLTKADVVALMVSLGKEALACGCGERCPRCECLVAITAAALWTRFTREESRGSMRTSRMPDGTPPF